MAISVEHSCPARMCDFAVRLLSNFNKQSLQLHPLPAETIRQSISWSIDQCNPNHSENYFNLLHVCSCFSLHCRLLDIWRRVLWYLGGLWCHVLDGVHTESVRHIHGPLYTHQGSAQVSAATKHETRWWASADDDDDDDDRACHMHELYNLSICTTPACHQVHHTSSRDIIEINCASSESARVDPPLSVVDPYWF